MLSIARSQFSRRVVFVFLAAVVGLFVAYRAQDSVARYLWQEHSYASMALLLNRSDTDLAMQLGGYFFGGQGRGGVATALRPYDLPKAKLAYTTAIETDPETPGAHYQLARIYLVEGKFDDALREINAAIDMYPENLRSLYIRGLIYGFRNFKGDYARAEEDFARFVAWAPSEWAGHNDLMWVLLKQEKYAEAKSVGKRAIEEADGGEDNPWLWNGLGVAQLNLGDYAEALRSSERALALAEKLTSDDWQKAYSGNNPRGTEGGLEAFKSGLRKNIEAAALRTR